MKIVITVLVLIALGGAVYWYGAGAGWFVGDGVTRPPTADELERMRAVEESSSQVAPDAKAGIGVVPVGSKPEPAPEPTPENVATTSDEELETEVQ
jgi:hypothetical protein